MDFIMLQSGRLLKQSWPSFFPIAWINRAKIQAFRKEGKVKARVSHHINTNTPISALFFLPPVKPFRIYIIYIRLLQKWYRPVRMQGTPWLKHRGQASSPSPLGRSCALGTRAPGPGSALSGRRAGSWSARWGCCECGCTRPSPGSALKPKKRYTKHESY